jgi:exodeoxyribonuclease VII small subunit
MSGQRKARTDGTDGGGAANGTPSFENALGRLSEIVERLEGGELPLEESLKLFEEGVRMARTAEARLDAAEKRVEELLGIDADGNPMVRELGDEGG